MTISESTFSSWPVISIACRAYSAGADAIMSTGFTTLAPAGKARSLVWLSSERTGTSSPRGRRRLHKESQAARVGYDPNTIAIRQWLIGEQGSDVKKFCEGIRADDSSLSEQCIDSNVRKRLAPCVKKWRVLPRKNVRSSPPRSVSYARRDAHL